MFIEERNKAFFAFGAEDASVLPSHQLNVPLTYTARENGQVRNIQQPRDMTEILKRGECLYLYSWGNEKEKDRQQAL